jgi:apolipoprotein N-acyltransferase
VVQGNIDNAFRWKRTFFERALNTYAALTAQANVSPQLIVWPENAVNFYIEREPVLHAQLGIIANQAREGLLLGAPRLSNGRDARNSARLIAPGGRIIATYDKRRLVPFAEYDPLTWLRQAGAAELGYKPGDSPAVLNAGAVPIGVVICYEILFPGLVRDVVRHGATVLVNLSNDSWMDQGDGVASQQHFSMSVFRAVETRRWLIRAASTGVSGFVSPIGTAHATVPIHTAGSSVFAVTPEHGETLYVRWGDTWVALVGMVVALGYVRGRARHR